jgi:hypothetical protein
VVDGIGRFNRQDAKSAKGNREWTNGREWMVFFLNREKRENRERFFGVG